MPDDETVNQMIARSEEEFELFMVSFCVFECEVKIQPCNNIVSPHLSLCFLLLASVAYGPGPTPRGGS